jgi:glycosyltransferase involved in cell wall biosynthesis
VSSQLKWSANVRHFDSSAGGRSLDPLDLVRDHYPASTGGLIILKNDPVEYTACGFTELIELMAMSRPVIVTRTGALPAQIDVEKAGCGLHVPPANPKALAAAMEALASDPNAARQMGENGRRMTETHYNTGRYAKELHTFFESL